MVATLRFRLVLCMALLFGAGALTSCNGDQNFEGDACARQGLVCPNGFVCNEVTGSCDCTGEGDACGAGSMCDTFTGRCICTDCCPDGFRFDETSVTCVCAGNDCCPPEHVFDEGTNRCVCTQEICCPDGFERDEAAGRCICQSDAACGEGFVCDQDTGDCMCQSDDVCDAGQFCNDFGFCQRLAACTSTYDCPDGHICDPGSGACVDAACVLDADCPISHICEDEICEPGCRTDDDCWLAEACIEGFCRGDVCNRDIQCGIGERCTGGACEQVSGSHCESCDPEDIFGGCPADSECVVQLVEGSSEPYCSVECTPDGSVPCPNGYSCNGTFAGGCDGNDFLCVLLDAGTHCHQVIVHNEPEPLWICGDADGPRPYRYGCGPVFGSCEHQPASGETTRPGLGEECTTLCQDGLVCANVGEGWRCYAACDASGGCAGGATCEPLAGGASGACVG